jgi:hypothetical protein
MAWKPDYVTLSAVKADRRIASTVDDAQIQRKITAASRAIDKHTHRQFGLVAAPEARRYTAEYSPRYGRYVVWIDDLMTTTGAALSTVDGSITDYDLLPVNAAAEGRPWTHLLVGVDSAIQPDCDPYGMTMLARWGWSAVPTAVEEATVLQTARFLARRDSAFGVAGSPDMGSELRLLSKVDADVGVSLAEYVRVRMPR